MIDNHPSHMTTRKLEKKHKKGGGEMILPIRATFSRPCLAADCDFRVDFDDPSMNYGRNELVMRLVQANEMEFEFLYFLHKAIRKSTSI